MVFGGCPSWIARRQGEGQGHTAGYAKGYSDAEEEIKGSVLTKEKIKELKNKLIKRVKAEVEAAERDTLEKKLRVELAERISNEAWLKAVEQIEKFKQNYKEETVLMPNFKIVIDNDVDRGGERVEERVAKKFERMGYEVQRCMYAGGGHPDLLCKKGLERLYVEVKSANDALRMNQAKWFLNNKDKNIMLYFVEMGD